MTTRIEFNVITGERKVINLSPEEIAAGLERKAIEEVQQNERKLKQDKVVLRQSLLDQLLDKLEVDATIIDRIR